MPAISIDTFFACSLMVLLVLSAMTATVKILHPLLNASAYNEAQRLGEVARRIMLYAGKPADWGKCGLTAPEEFGLAMAEAETPYTLDPDKVSRLNSENVYCLSYAQIFTSLKTPDLSIRIEVKPLFNVKLNLTATFESVDKRVYTFEATLERDSGVRVSANLKVYALAGSLFLQNSILPNVDGEASFNITAPKSLESPILLVVFAKSTQNSRIASYAVYYLAGGEKPLPKGAFLRLSPINQTLTITSTCSGVFLEGVYAITFNHVGRLSQTRNNVFGIPLFVDASPMVLVATGWNTTQRFIEWTAYPQIPLQTGVNFSNLLSTLNVYVYEHLVSINHCIYKCAIFLGGLKG